MTQNDNEHLNFCVAIATYNNEKTLQKIVAESLVYANSVVVVNDGSTDQTAEILKSFGDKISVVHHGTNKGKGRALRTAFDWARQNGFDYLISIDSDGQHFPADIPNFINEINQNGDALLIGSRNMDQDHIPGKSSFGNRFSNFWFRFETGIKLQDTQSGFRLYPLVAMKKRKYWTSKFEFEIEVIVKAAWEGITVKNIPIQIHYDIGDERISHFRPFQDFSRISVLNTVLVVMALLYYIPMRFTRKLTRENIKHFIKTQLLNSTESNLKKSGSIGFGVFMGIFPIWGYQLLVGIPLAHFFKMNKALFVVAANISIPPMIPFIIYGSYLVGGYFVSDPTALNFDSGISLQLIHENFVQYFIGAIALAILAGIAAFVVSFATVFISRKMRVKPDNQ